MMCEGHSDEDQTEPVPFIPTDISRNCLVFYILITFCVDKEFEIYSNMPHGCENLRLVKTQNVL
jgi:hypothetical protein